MFRSYIKKNCSEHKESNKFKYNTHIFLYDKDVLKYSDAVLKGIRLEFEYFFLDLSAFKDNLKLGSYRYVNNGYGADMYYVDLPINAILAKTPAYVKFKELMYNNCPSGQIGYFQKMFKRLERECKSQHLQEMNSGKSSEEVSKSTPRFG